MPEAIVFSARDLIPPSWRKIFSEGPVRIFNPGLLRDGPNWIFAYRVVGPDLNRRIALCRLDPGFHVIAGSRVAWSDAVRFFPGSDYPEPVTRWFADPRLYRWGPRLFLHWNSGWHDPRNYQFIQALDPADLRPVGFPRELKLGRERRAIEKNWTFFGDDPLYALYSPSPLRILQFSVEGEGDIEFSEVSSTVWSNRDYADKFGELRGGAPPQKVGDDYFGVGHSVFGPPGHYRYVAAAYRFASQPPFAPRAAPAGPLSLIDPIGADRDHPRLNPVIAEVVYPCGAVYEAGRWIVSFGLNDEKCAISFIAQTEMLAGLKPL